VSNYFQSLYVDLHKKYRIIGLATMGYENSWVSEYAIQYSQDGDHFAPVQVNPYAGGAQEQVCLLYS